MPHLEPDVLRRILRGESGPLEIEQAAEHIVSCDRCREQAGSLLDELRAVRPGRQGEGPLQLVFDLSDRARRWGMEALSALGARAEVRHMPGRRRERAR